MKVIQLVGPIKNKEKWQEHFSFVEDSLSTYFAEAKIINPAIFSKEQPPIEPKDWSKFVRKLNDYLQISQETNIEKNDGFYLATTISSLIFLADTIYITYDTPMSLGALAETSVAERLNKNIIAEIPSNHQALQNIFSSFAASIVSNPKAKPCIQFNLISGGLFIGPQIENDKNKNLAIKVEMGYEKARDFLFSPEAIQPFAEKYIYKDIAYFETSSPNFILALNLRASEFMSEQNLSKEGMGPNAAYVRASNQT